MSVKFTVSLYQETTDDRTWWWIAQAHEKNICVQGRTRSQARKAFELVTQRLYQIAKERGEKPFARLKPPPDYPMAPIVVEWEIPIDGWRVNKSRQRY